MCTTMLKHIRASPHTKTIQVRCPRRNTNIDKQSIVTINVLRTCIEQPNMAAPCSLYIYIYYPSAPLGPSGCEAEVESQAEKSSSPAVLEFCSNCPIMSEMSAQLFVSRANNQDLPPPDRVASALALRVGPKPEIASSAPRCLSHWPFGPPSVHQTAKTLIY